MKYPTRLSIYVNCAMAGIAVGGATRDPMLGVAAFFALLCVCTAILYHKDP